MKTFTQLTHFAGFDWAKQHHHVVILDAHGQVVAERRFEHTATGWQQLRQQFQSWPALGVAIEIPQWRDAAVEKLLECDVTVYPVAPNPAVAGLPAPSSAQRRQERLRGRLEPGRCAATGRRSLETARA